MRKTAHRFDLQKNDKIEFTSQGFLRVPVFAGRTGIQTYIDENGNEIREFRPPEEVFSDIAMSSLTMIPVVNNHPDTMVDSDNARLLAVGFTGEHVEKVDNKFLKTTAVIFDKLTIEDIRKGKVEVSLGYDVELDETPGVFDGQEYDVVQRNIVHNHLALVDKGRAGAEVRLRLDSNSAILKDERIVIIKREDSTMKMKIGDKEFEVNDEVGEAIKKVVDENESFKKAEKDAEEEEEKKKEDNKHEEDAKEEDAEEEEEEEKKEEDRADREAARADALAAENKKLKRGSINESRVDELVRSRTKTLEVASKVLDNDTKSKMDSMSTTALKKAIVEVESGEKMSGKTEVYIAARFDHIAATVNNSDKAHEKMGDVISQRRKEDAEKVDAAQARIDRMKKDSERWKNPIGRTKNSFIKAV